jgi:protein TonB
LCGLTIGSIILGVSFTKAFAQKPSDSISSRINTNSIKTDNDSILFYDVISKEKMPLSPGGERRMLDFIHRSIKYPEKALKERTQGTVLIRFLLTTEGKVGKIEVSHSLSLECDMEAKRIIKSLQEFIPVIQNGKNARVWFTIPITFKLKK